MWSRVDISRKFITIPRQQLAVALQSGMYSLDDRSARRGLDGRRCPISLHLRRGGCWSFAIGSTGDDLGL
jgi:hypothetical protein